MAKKSDKSAAPAVSDEQKQLLTDLYVALGALLGLSTPATPGELSELGGDTPADGGGDLDGLGDTPGDDGLDGLGGDDKPAEITEEQVRDAFKGVLKKHGKDKGREKAALIMKKFGAATLPEIKVKNYEAVIELCKKHS